MQTRIMCPNCIHDFHIEHEKGGAITIQCPRCDHIWDENILTEIGTKLAFCDFGTGSDRGCEGGSFTVGFTDGHYLLACINHLPDMIFAAHKYLSIDETIRIEYDK